MSTQAFIAWFVSIAWFDYVGYLGAALGLAAMAMRTIIPLRLVAIGGCTCLAVFAAYHGAWPTLILNAATVPVLIWRSWEMLRLTRRIAVAAESDFSLDALKPYMTARRIGAGETLVRKGDPAVEMYCVANGRLRILEYHAAVGPGEFAGEIALFSPDRVRTATIVAELDTEYFALDDAVLKQLYFQNPAFGFHLIRLVTRRLVANMRRLETASAPSS